MVASNVLKVEIDSLSDCLFLEGGFGGNLAASQAVIAEAAKLAVEAVVNADAKSLEKFQMALTDSLGQVQSIVAAKAACAAFRKGLETPVPTTPVEPPVVIELPAPVEPAPVEPTPEIKPEA